MAEALLAFYFLLLFASLIFKTRILSGPWLFLLRAFFPNWKFFHAVGHVPHLYVRAALPDAHGKPQWEAWRLIYPRRERRLAHLVHNPDTNLALVQQNLIEHLATDLNYLAEGLDPRSLVSYQLVARLVRQTQHALWPQAVHSQFEVRMQLDGPQGPIEQETMLRSEALECQ